MTVYVHRRGDNTIASVHADLQPDYAEEALADDDPELVAWRAANLAPAPTPTIEQKLESLGIPLGDLRTALGL